MEAVTQLATPTRRSVPLHLVLGALALVASEALLLEGIEPVHTYFYCFAWWSYILLADGWVKWREGESLLVDRTGEFLVLCFWSVAFWNLFELFNFVLHDWYYVEVPPSRLGQALNMTLAFATVLPGTFVTAELLASFGLFERVRTRPWKVGRGFRATTFSLGLLCLVLPLFQAGLFFGLIWGATAFLLEPVVHARGGRSLLADFERGDPRRLLRLLAAGFITGGLWEFFNFWTRTKWIYTVPGLERVKLFEMPLLGFLGFPPFVVELYVMYAFLGLFRGGRGWERGATGRGAKRWVAVVGALLGIAFNVAVFFGVERWTVSSHDEPLAGLPGVTAEEAERMASQGITRPFDLLRASERLGPEAVAQASGLGSGRVESLIPICRLAEAKGIGVTNVRLLDRVGVHDLRGLSTRDPDNLTLALEPVAEAAGVPAPREPQVEVWIREALRREH